MNIRAGQPPLRHRLHRVLGASSGLILIYLVLTGLPLQFTDEMNLASRHVSNPALLDWYGLHAPDNATSSATLVHIGERLYLQSLPIAESPQFIGAVAVGDLTLALVGRELLLIQSAKNQHLQNGQLPPIERLPLSEPGLRIGLLGNRVLIDTGAALLELDDDLLNAEPSSLAATDVEWAGTRELTGPDLAAARGDYREGMLSAERLLQDLHSGRLFGTPGVWILNIGTLLLILLAITGLLIWWRTRS